MNYDDYRRCDSTGLAKLIADREVSAEEVLDCCIERIEAVNPTVNAVVQKQYDTARAAIADGLPDGPLKGVPYLIKDLHYLEKGQPSSNGSRLFADRVADHDSTYVARCKAAGLVIVGRSNTPELGLNLSTEPVLHGPTRNPWNLKHSAGGSSGGAAAAVAAGMLPAAHATDGGGSIRIPAANCGLIGLKPTRGRNPAGPVDGEGWNGMSTGHVVSRSVRDTALFLDCTHGPEAGDPYAAPPPKGRYIDAVGRDPGQLRIAMMTTDHLGEPINAECVAAIEAAGKLCESLGHIVEPARPAFDVMALRQVQRTLISANIASLVNGYAESLGRDLTPDDVEAATWAMTQGATEITATDVIRAIATMHRLARQLGAFFEDYDVLLGTTMPNPPVELGYIDMNSDDLRTYGKRAGTEGRLTPIFNATGCPAISLPLAWSESGLPIGVHFGAALGGEETLIGLAAQLETAAPWFDKIPNLEDEAA